MLLYLGRHCETEWNEENKWQSRSDVALAESGRERALKLGDLLASDRIDLILHSPARRVVETLDLLDHQKGVKRTAEPLLRELDLGEWEGLTTEEIRERFGDGVDIWLSDPRLAAPTGGESYESALARAKGFTMKHSESLSQANVLVMGHQMLNAIILTQVCRDFRETNPAQLRQRSGQVDVVRFPSGEHLRRISPE